MCIYSVDTILSFDGRIMGGFNFLHAFTHVLIFLSMYVTLFLILIWDIKNIVHHKE